MRESSVGCRFEMDQKIQGRSAKEEREIRPGKAREETGKRHATYLQRAPILPFQACPRP